MFPDSQKNTNNNVIIPHFEITWTNPDNDTKLVWELCTDKTYRINYEKFHLNISNGSRVMRKHTGQNGTLILHLSWFINIQWISIIHSLDVLFLNIAIRISYIPWSFACNNTLAATLRISSVTAARAAYGKSDRARCERHVSSSWVSPPPPLPLCRHDLRDRDLDRARCRWVDSARLLLLSR